MCVLKNIIDLTKPGYLLCHLFLCNTTAGHMTKKFDKKCEILHCIIVVRLKIEHWIKIFLYCSA